MRKVCYEKKISNYSEKFQDFKIESVQDGINIGVTIYVPNKVIKGVLQISHGMMEHRKRYIEFMNFIGENGYICVVHDHIGHGESVKSEKNLVIINTRKFDELTNFIRKMGYKNIVSNIYLNKYHDLLHEKNKLEIYNDILQWINGI